MDKMLRTLLVCFAAALAWAQSAGGPGLKGTVTDPSGAFVPDALVQLVGPGGQQRATTNENGQYTFAALKPGRYTIRYIAKGFTLQIKKDVDITAPVTMDVQLTIEEQAQVLNVEDEAARVDVAPDSNASALVIGEKELATLSDDPDELEQQLQAMAGPTAGPNGGQIFIDGFSGGNMPPKSSIREVRINSNPYSPEYDRPGFGRIEILTKPGTDYIRGQAFFQFNDESLNSRSPLLTQSTRPPMQTKFFGINLSGPIKKQKASFGFDFERRMIDENAFVYATTLDSNLNPVPVNEGVPTPQTRTTITPRIDYSINAMNTLVLRYQDAWTSVQNEGVGSYALASKGYDQTNRQHMLQLTETAILSPKAITETRFQYLHQNLSRTGDNSIPALSVQGAFEGGGAQVGNSGTVSNHFELSNITTLTHGTHIFKFGARMRQSLLDDTSVNNFGGTYTFFGGLGPLLDSDNQIIPGSSVQLTALERYQRTLYFQQLGYTSDQIRLLGGGASQFTMGAGTPISAVNQFDIGLFVNDDWRIRQNITLSYGLRYEGQTNIHDLSALSPRVGIAWGLSHKGQVKTVIRAGFGTFFDRISDSTILSSYRFNGTTQQSYLIRNPDFFPVIPTADVLAQFQQPQSLQIVDNSIKAGRNYQGSVGVERQINKYAKVSAQYVFSRGVHLDRSVNINAPTLTGGYPYGDADVRNLTESTGFSRINQLIISPNINYKKIFLFGFYALSYGKTDAEGMPANPYDLRSEWGPASFGDVRHRAVIGTNLPLPWKVSVSPFMMVSSGTPYNITTGRDANLDGFTTERPSLVNLGPASCVGGNYVYSPLFGCFDLLPTAGTAITRNYGRGPSNFTLNMRVSRTWSFGQKGESGAANSGFGGPGGPGGGGGMRGGGGGMRGGGMGGPPGGGPGGPGGMFGGASSGKKYNLQLSVQAHNILNHPNYAAPSGDLSSPYFGESRSLAGFGPLGGASTYNRKIDLQLRFMF